MTTGTFQAITYFKNEIHSEIYRNTHKTGLERYFKYNRVS